MGLPSDTEPPKNVEPGNTSSPSVSDDTAIHLR